MSETRNYTNEVDEKVAALAHKGGWVEVYDVEYSKRGDVWKDPEGHPWNEASWWAAYEEGLHVYHQQSKNGEITAAELCALLEGAFVTMVQSGMVQAPAAIKAEIAKELEDRNLPVSEFYKRLYGAIVAWRGDTAQRRRNLIGRKDILGKMMQQLEDGAVCIICHGPLGYKPEERKQARKDLHAKPMCLCIKGNAYKNNVLLTHCLECACKQASKRIPHNPGCESVLFMPGNLSSMNSIRLL